MSSLRTYIIAALMALSSASPSAATGGIYGDPVTFFATCTGRLSAELEFQWLLSAPEADQTKAHRAALIDILSALTPRDQGAEILHRRVSAKMAHAQLLTTARFSLDAAEARHAAETAARLTRGCTDLLLS